MGFEASRLAIPDCVLTSFTAFIDLIYPLIVARLSASILLTFKDMGIQSAPTDLTDRSDGGISGNIGKS